MAKLTGDQVAAIQGSQKFIDRVSAVLKVKAQYWATIPTSARADVNRAMQKRKRLAATIENTTWAESYKAQVAQFWIGWYAWNVDPAAALDSESLPTYDTIFNAFDPTWDNFALVLAGDASQTEIEW